MHNTDTRAAMIIHVVHDKVDDMSDAGTCIQSPSVLAPPLSRLWVKTSQERIIKSALKGVILKCDAVTFSGRTGSLAVCLPQDLRAPKLMIAQWGTH